jgi:hypothetical protein
MSDIKESIADFNHPLRDRNDWERWNSQFNSLVSIYRVKHCILGDEEPIKRPNPPDIRNYLASQVTTRAASVTEIESQAATPDAQVVTSRNLTAENMRLYQFDYQVYSDQRKAYEAEGQALTKVHEWMRKTISNHFQEITFGEDDTLKQWYKKVKEHVAIDDYRVKELALQKYATAIKPLTNLKHAEKWLTTWEQAMDTATKNKMPIASEPVQWLSEFRQAVKGVMPIWAENARMNLTPKARDNSISYRQLAGDFRDAIASAGVFRDAMVSAGGRKVVKGSFAALGDSTKEEETAEETTSAAAKKKQKKRKQTSSFSETVCRGCGGRHGHRRCFYLFPQFAPDDWVPKKFMQQVTEASLKEDSALAKEVERLKKKYGNEDVKEE